MANKNRSQVKNPNIDELSIYEGGSVNGINIDDLLDNKTAITQLINSHNLKIIELKHSQTQVNKLNCEIEYLKTAPFISIIASIVNVIGSIVIAVGVNLLSTPKSDDYDRLLIAIGFLLVVVGSLCTILYPYARNWFNKKGKKDENPTAN